MALYDKILLEYLDGNEQKVSDTKKSEIFDSLEKILKEGPQSIPGLPVPPGLNFQPDGAYNDLNFRETPFLKKFEEKVVDGLLKDVFKMLNLNGQTPFPLIFDTTGLLPNLPVPPNLTLSIPPTPVQILLLLSIPTDIITDLLDLPSLGLNLDQVKDLSLDELKLKLPEKKINNMSDLIKENINKIQPPPLSADQLKDLFNPFKLIPSPPVIVPKVDFLKNVQITIQPLIETLNTPTIVLSADVISLILGQITSLQQTIAKQHLDIVTFPVKILTELIATVFSSISKLANPIALVQSIFSDLILAIGNLLFPHPPGIQIQSNQQIIMKIATSIVLAKFILKAVLSVLIGLFLGKGLISQNASKLI
jgi:hypothetical protein